MFVAVTHVPSAKIGVGPGVGIALFGLKTRYGLSFEGLTAVGLYVEYFPPVSELGQSNRQAIAPSTPGAPDAVCVVLGLHGQTKIKHMADGWHIKATRGDISGDQYLHLALAQSHQATVAQTLAQSTMQGYSRESFLLQVVGQTITFDLRAGKHNRLVDAGVTQPMVEQLALVLRIVGPEQDLLDVHMLVLWRVDRDALRLPHDPCSKLLDARCKSGTEHHGLFALQGELIDFSQIVRKAQIQHAIGLVHHQKLHPIELDLHRPLQIQQTTGRCHHQIGVLQLGDLQLIRHAADNVRNTQAAAMLDQFDGIMGHLLRELPGRADDQGPRGDHRKIARVGGVFALAAFRRSFAFRGSLCQGSLKIRALFVLGLALLVQQCMQNWQQKRCRFAAAGLARYHQVNKTGPRITRVQALHGQGYGCLLHWGWLGVA